jgi:hypothetical protein
MLNSNLCRAQANDCLLFAIEQPDDAGTLSSIATGWQTLADQIDRYHARGPDTDPAFGAESKVRQVSIFLVEDETLIRMMIADMIGELGHTVVAEAANIADALRLAETVDFGIAILDTSILVVTGLSRSRK